MQQNAILEEVPSAREAGLRLWFAGKNSGAAELEPYCREIVARAAGRALPVVIPRQVHGARSVDLRREHGAIDSVREIEADAVIASRDTSQLGSLAIGVLAADCVPLCFAGDSSVAVVHAGWRGLAARIIPQVMQSLGEPLRYAYVGACAGAEIYEVGPEVLDAIGRESAVWKPLSEAKMLLNLRQTAAAQIAELAPQLVVQISEYCTMTNPALHSFRRDAERAGRNLLFCLI